MAVRILQGDCRQVLPTLPAESVQCCVTSPPYWNLRDYGTATWEGGDPDCDHGVRTWNGTRQAKGSQSGHASAADRLERAECRCGAVRNDQQLGLEPTPEEYVANMVAVFREVRRILRTDGCLWLNLGDSYAKKPGRQVRQPERDNCGGFTSGRRESRGEQDWVSGAASETFAASFGGAKNKELVGIPWRVAFALSADGWYLRADCVWNKPNAKPESVTDRPAKAHEYVFLLTKREDYYYDSEAVRSATSNLRSVWDITTKSYTGAHTAVMPPDLAALCLRASTSEGGACSACGAPRRRIVEKGEPDREQQRACGGDAEGEYHGQATKDFEAHRAEDASALKARILAGMRVRRTLGWEPTCGCGEALESVPCLVLDPFGGTGTTALAASKLGVDALLIELDPAAIAQAKDRNINRSLFG